MPHYIQVETAHNVKIDYEVASLWDRILGDIIDSLVMIAYIFLLAFIVSLLAEGGDFFPDRDGATVGIVIGIIIFSPIVFYNLLMEIFFNGQSIGKMALKTKVVAINGQPVTIGSYFIRWLMRIIDFQLASGLVALVAVAAGGKGQRLGDMVAGTAVISLKPRTSLRNTAYVKIAEDYQPQYPEVQHKLSNEDIVLVKEVLQLREDNRYELINKVAEKVQATLEVPMRERAHPYLMTILKDYNYYNNNEVDVEKELRRGFEN